MSVLRIPVKTEAPARIWLMDSVAIVFRDILELSAKLVRDTLRKVGSVRGFSWVRSPSLAWFAFETLPFRLPQSTSAHAVIKSKLNVEYTLAHHIKSDSI